MIKTVNDALSMRKAGMKITDGIFFVNTDFSRGFDAKLDKNAFVFVVLFDPNLGVFSLSDILQMIGRGNRSRGSAEGKVFAMESENPLIENFLDGLDDWFSNHTAPNLAHFCLYNSALKRYPANIEQCAVLFH